MVDETDWGFPKGRVAKTLRTLLYKDLSDHDVEAIVVCLISHLLVEDHINSLLYSWLLYDLPWKQEDSNEETETGLKKMKDAIWKSITKLQFAQKYQVIESVFTYWFPKEASEIWKLNELRNDIFHGKGIKDVIFKGKSISTEEGIEDVYMTAQSISMRFYELEELLGTQHALAEKWAERLKELGEPLM
jgi:hypothetical protein